METKRGKNCGFRADCRLSVSYCLSNGSEKASLVWKDQARQVGFSEAICPDVLNRRIQADARFQSEPETKRAWAMMRESRSPPAQFSVSHYLAPIHSRSSREAFLKTNADGRFSPFQGESSSAKGFEATRLRSAHKPDRRLSNHRLSQQLLQLQTQALVRS